jgi:hypothetical protein
MISRFSAELVTAAATAVIGIVTVVGAREYGVGWSSSGPQPGTFPFYIGLLIAAASLGTIVQTLLERRRLDASFLTGEQLRAVALFALPIFAFVIVSMWLGLYVAMALYLFASMSFQGGYRSYVAAPLAIGIAVFFYVVLEVAFQVPLLKGPLESALGL